MVIINWNPYVNTEIYIDGDYGWEDGIVESVTFESGKERLFLKNTYASREFGSLELVLNNADTILNNTDDNTEFKQFKYWYEISLRYGILPFTMPKLLYPKRAAVYQFLPDSLRLEGTGAYITATFGLKEIG